MYHLCYQCAYNSRSWSLSLMITYHESICLHIFQLGKKSQLGWNLYKRCTKTLAACPKVWFFFPFQNFHISQPGSHLCQLLNFIFTYLFMWDGDIHTRVHTHARVYVQRSKDNWQECLPSLLPPGGSQELNLGCQA